MAELDKECDDLRKLETEELKQVYGGEIHITILLELGRSLGSSLRRLIDGNICTYK